MEKTRLISKDIVQEALTDGLRRYVGFGKDISVSAFAASTGVSESTVYETRQGNMIPSFETILKFAAVLPETFMSEIIAPAGLGGVERLERQDVDANAVLVDLARQCAEMAERLRDGKFCHIDCSVVGPQLIALAHLLEAQGNAMKERNR